MLETLSFDGHSLTLLDQRKLPLIEESFVCKDVADVADGIRWMVVRGAPAIGVTAAYGLALAALAARGSDASGFRQALEDAARLLVGTRPTAVNLRWAVDRVMAQTRGRLDRGEAVDAVAAGVVAEAERMHAEDIETNRAIGRHGGALLSDGDTVLTHCNAGSLATAGYGTALGVVRGAVEAGKRIAVLADETRPFLQGARLTAFELHRDGIPVTVITDNMAGHVLKSGKVKAVVVGADRIARNGDTANKIGTYTVAVLARENGVPFYVAAPLSTVDLATATGDDIVIEERDPDEVTQVAGTRVVPPGVPVLNPAFDVTPARYVTGIVTEDGVARPPYLTSLAELFAARAARVSAGRGGGGAGTE